MSNTEESVWVDEDNSEDVAEDVSNMSEIDVAPETILDDTPCEDAIIGNEDKMSVLKKLVTVAELDTPFGDDICS